MNPADKITALEEKRGALESQLVTGMDKDREIAIRQQIIAVDGQITMWGGHVRRPEEVPFTWENFKLNTWNRLPDAIYCAGCVGGATWMVTHNKQYGFAAGFSAFVMTAVSPSSGRRDW